MTLNFVSYAPFSDLIRSDDEFGAVGFSTNWLSQDFYEFYENKKGKLDWIDPVDLLPDDPFGMELGSNLAVAIAGWIEDLNVDSNNWEFCYLNNDSVGSGENSSFENIVPNGLCDYEIYCCNENSGKDCNSSSYFYNFESFGISNVVNGSIGAKEDEDKESMLHDGLILSLGYLDVGDLLSVDRVCKSLHFAVQSDPLLWRCVHIDSPLSEKINDDILDKMCLKAQGSLECLSLKGCSRITDDGLRKVLESNPMLQKLSVSDCHRLSMDGLINNLKAFKTLNNTGVKNLKLGRSFSVSLEHYEALQLSLGRDDITQAKPYKPRFYHIGASSIACYNDGRALDIELCAGCQKYKLVFDCPSEDCQGKGVDLCRACDLCIERCVQCGRCVKDCQFVETFFMDYICSDCWKQTP